MVRQLGCPLEGKDAVLQYRRHVVHRHYALELSDTWVHGYGAVFIAASNRFIRSSPKMSLGNSESRRAARVRASGSSLEISLQFFTQQPFDFGDKSLGLFQHFRDLCVLEFIKRKIITRLPVLEQAIERFSPLRIK